VPARPPVDLAKGDEVAAWIEKHCCHVKGEWAGQPLILAPWQRALVRDLFGTLRPDGRRQYRTALVGLGRKGGKSSLGAAMALRLLFRDGEPGSEVFSCAADRDQAAIVFEIAKGMVEASPAMSKIAKVYRRAIVVPRTGSTYKVLSAEAYSKHGLNPHGVIFDELHAQPDRELWDTLTTGQGARRQPLTIAITTAGYDRESICWELYHYGRQIEAGVLEDPTFLFRWWGAAEDDSWDDEATWRKAQPNLGISVSLEFMRAEACQARQQPARENTFRRLYLNQWTQQATRWLSLDAWDATAGMVVETKLHGRACYGGLDLASTQDLTALALDFPDDDGGHQVLWRFWLPEERLQDLDRRTAGQASVWVRSGWLSLTPGNVVDHAAILAQIDRDARAFDVREVAYDRWGMTQIAQDLQDNGLTVVPFGQGFSAMSGPTREFERLVLDRKYVHGGNPVMRWMVDHLVVKTDPAGNLKLDRQRSTDKIDGAIAAVMALDRALRHAHRPRSAYEDRDLEVV
jgi:phage terminase large subunit-like protein